MTGFCGVIIKHRSLIPAFKQSTMPVESTSQRRKLAEVQGHTLPFSQLLHLLVLAGWDARSLSHTQHLCVGSVQGCYFQHTYH